MADIVAKIRKLLALSKSSNPHEAALAAQLAQELMIQHALSEEEVSGVPKEERVGKERMGTTHSGRVPAWHGYLANVLAGHFMCRVFLAPGEGHYVVGRKTNREVLGATWDHLRSEIQRLGDEGWRKRLDEGGPRYAALLKTRACHAVLREAGIEPNPQRWKRGFAFGAIVTIGERLDESRKKLSAGSKSVAIVLVSRSAEVDEFVKSSMDVARGRRAEIPATGFAEGREAGRRLDLSPRAAPTRRLAGS